jgi:hypothetical protein
MQNTCFLCRRLGPFATSLARRAALRPATYFEAAA